MITQQEIMRVLLYDPDTGEFYWRTTGKGRKKKPGFVHNSDLGPRLMIYIDGKRYLASRLAWIYVYGKITLDIIDHINNDPLDNRIANLREASYTNNACNTKLRYNSESKIKGVRWERNGWKAKVTIGQIVSSKRFKIKEDAILWVMNERRRLHGEFHCDG